LTDSGWFHFIHPKHENRHPERRIAPQHNVIFTR
jgi:hypothetical protein